MDSTKWKELNRLALANQQAIFTPDSSLHRFAFERVVSLQIENLADSFLAFSSFNYLNSESNRNPLGFDFGWKKRLGVAVTKTRAKGLGVQFYYEDRRGLLFVSFGPFQFSFGHPYLREDLALILSSAQPLYFDGIKKQPCADLILRCAMKNPALSPLSNVSKASKEAKEEPAVSPCEKGSATRSFAYALYPVNEILSDFGLRRIIPDKVTAKNVAMVLSLLYFYKDLISTAKPKLEEDLQRAIFREIITQSFSVIECCEIEAGAQLIHKKRSVKHDKNEDRQLRQELGRHLVLEKGSKEAEMMEKYRDLRNNVHLSKAQSIATDSNYTAPEVERWFSFMLQYVVAIRSCLEETLGE